ncbi:hypothetical protein NIES4102_06080 [Chondrocystis sp. NIES-4102]|nr:hypothetical protein NIES4102_06080 [Chondrocystis sp. NIES-4102]
MGFAEISNQTINRIPAPAIAPLINYQNERALSSTVEDAKAKIRAILAAKNNFKAKTRIDYFSSNRFYIRS